MSRLQEFLDRGRVLLMDGAMGTELQKAGLSDGGSAELWNLTRPDTVRAIHESYLRAESQCLVTNTFQSNPQALRNRGLDGNLAAINRAAVEIARAAGNGSHLVLGSVGPMEGITNSAEMTAILDSFAGVDGLLFETWPEAGLFFELFDRLRIRMTDASPPVLVSFTFRKTASGALATIDGCTPEQIAERMPAKDLAALGTNCGRDIAVGDTAEILRRYRSATDLPLFARPNAGSPAKTSAGWTYPEALRPWAEQSLAVLEAGARMFGGCCGTTPEHIAACRPLMATWNAV